METIDERLELLLSSNQISPLSSRTTRLLLDKVEDRDKRFLSGENTIMFVTHIALTIERVTKGEPVKTTLPKGLLDEVRSHMDDWTFAEDLSRLVQQEIGTPIPESEVGYIAAHLAALTLEE